MLRKSPRLAERDADAAEDFADDPTAARRSIVFHIYRCPQRFAAGIAQAGGFLRPYFFAAQPVPSPAAWG